MGTEVSALQPRLVQSIPTELKSSTNISKTSQTESYKAEVSFSDGLGNSFNLSLGRETKFHAVAYDRIGRLSVSGQEPSADSFKSIAKDIRAELKETKKALKGLKEAIKNDPELRKAFREMKAEIKAFKRELQQMLRAVDKGYSGFHNRIEPEGSQPFNGGVEIIEAEHFEATSFRQNLTIEMDVVDTEYWSVDNTSSRMADFAVALYDGGDRQEHFEEMAASMEKGYAEAKEAFGGWLPEISRETVDKAIDMLKSWAAEGAQQTLPEEKKAAQLASPMAKEEIILNNQKYADQPVAAAASAIDLSA